MKRKKRGQVCIYCERKLEDIESPSQLAATRDHVLPKSKGGYGYKKRLVWCCRQCNSLKANKMPWEWSAFMRQNPEWWRRPEFQRSNFKLHAHR